MAELTRTEQVQMARIREVLIRSPDARQRAVAEFPLKVADLAIAMKDCCDLRDMHRGDCAPETEDAIALMESAILKAFRETFGSEMTTIGQE